MSLFRPCLVAVEGAMLNETSRMDPISQVEELQNFMGRREMPPMQFFRVSGISLSGGRRGSAEERGQVDVVYNDLSTIKQVIKLMTN